MNMAGESSEEIRREPNLDKDAKASDVKGTDTRGAMAKPGDNFKPMNGSSSSYKERSGGDYKSNEGRNSEFRGNERGSDRAERPRSAPLEVHVESGHNIEKAIKVLKRKLIREGLFKELKMRRYYEKPSERKKRKSKESIKKARKDEARNKKNQMLF